MDELRDRVALVTGADRGIGAAIALALGRAGAHVAVGYRTGEDGARAVAASVAGLGRRSMAVRADLGRVEEATRAAEEASRSLGSIDVLVCNAGIAPARELVDLDAAVFDETVAVNLRAAFVLTQAVLPAMRGRRWGRLLYVSSTAAQVGGIVGPHYAASKAGLVGLAHAYAARGAAEGITANVLAPALIETEMIRANARARPDRIPVGRFGTAGEVADVAVALLANAYVTGQTIQVNGGVYFT